MITHLDVDIRVRSTYPQKIGNSYYLHVFP